jgi:hypothetical protein
VQLEDLAEPQAGRLLDALIDLDELDVADSGEPRADRRLARAANAEQRDDARRADRWRGAREDVSEMLPRPDSSWAKNRSETPEPSDSWRRDRPSRSRSARIRAPTVVSNDSRSMPALYFKMQTAASNKLLV